MSLNAYRQAASRAESPRDMEYRLFAEVTLALIEASKLDPADVGGRADAVMYEAKRAYYARPAKERRGSKAAA